MDLDMDLHVWSIVLSHWKGDQVDGLRYRLASRCSVHEVSRTLSQVCADKCCLLSETAQARLASLCSFLRANPNVRRVSLRQAKIQTCDLELLVGCTAGATEFDVSLALPLSWPQYSRLTKQLETQGRRVFDTLQLSPSPSLSSEAVVITQAYALHCNRIDVCFKFASPANRSAVGPLERFSSFFTHPSPYSAMVSCKRFSLIPHGLSSYTVAFFDQEGQEDLFMWHLSKQVAGEFEGCWMTDSVMPLSIHSVFDGSFLDE
eukprot:TRINITY_DN24346_c0_g1_i1.p1 TRINITY_DN24346_c0_g1~~TRINITY_DN24346_c0_g1_i1.p1  ORF type:complete len:261 (+),score=13.83 TRINITY_DN24346_c0_g1_i1:121-903(+)